MAYPQVDQRMGRGVMRFRRALFRLGAHLYARRRARRDQVHRARQPTGRAPLQLAGDRRLYRVGDIAFGHDRIDDADKRWKFNPRDLEERKRWDDYMQAYEAALSETSTEHAPWYIVPADSKSTRNVIVSSVLIHTLEALKISYPQPERDVSGIVVE